MQSEREIVHRDHEGGSTDKDGFLDRTSTVFLTSLVVRLLVAGLFLGSVDAVNSVSFMPVAASHGYFYLPYFPIVDNILGFSALLMNHVRFLPVGLFPKLLPCVADSLLSVWLLHYDRFDATFRRRAAWIYTFCPLTIILVCLEGQWDSLWILPMLAALAMSMQLREGSPNRFRTCLLIGVLLGFAIVSKPVAVLVAGLLIPNVHHRESLMSWFKELATIAVGAMLTVAAFFVVFAGEGINLVRNLKGVLNYGGSPGFIVFGPAHLTIFHFLVDLQKNASVIGDFRTFSVFFVLGIVALQLFSKTPMEPMAAAASVLLLAPAVGGLAAQYLVWPLVFIIASGRLRLAVWYSGATSILLLIYFLIPGSSVMPGENIGTYLPLRSLRFLGVPTSLLHWAATTRLTHEVWLPILNLYLPVAMCALALYLLMSKWRAEPSPEGVLLEPSQLRSTRVFVPYAAMLIVAVLTYLVEPTHVKKALIGVVQSGLAHYGFQRTIYSWFTWHKVLYWTVTSPYKDVLGGAWWGSVIVFAPILIALWCYFALWGKGVLGTGARVHRSDRASERST